MLRKFPTLFPLVMLVLGITLADSISLSAWTYLLFGLIGLVGALIFFTKDLQTASIFFFAFALCFWAGSYYTVRVVDHGPNNISAVINAKEIVHISGKIVEWPDMKANRTELTIEIDSVASKSSVRVNGRILLKVADTTTALQRGDRVHFFGRIYPVSSREVKTGFNYGRFLRLKGISGTVYLSSILNVKLERRSQSGYFAAIDKLRNGTLNTFQSTLSPQAAALASGFLIGHTRDISQDVYTLFRETGTLHLLAVSGSNVALVLLFFMLIMRPFPIKPIKRGIVLLIVLLLFTFVSYSEPSVVRASVMAALVIIARLMGRKVSLTNIIALAALIILVYDPGQLFDIGFQLSFVTAWGLILLVPPIIEVLGKSKQRGQALWFRFLMIPLIVSLVAQICSAPLIAFYFGAVPLISIAANIFLVPLVSLAVIGSLVVIVAFLAWPGLGLFLGSLVNALLVFGLYLLNMFGHEHLPMLRFGGENESIFGITAFALLYLFIVLTVFSLGKKSIRRYAVIVLFVLLNTLFVPAVMSAKRHQLDIIAVTTLQSGLAVMTGREGAGTADLYLTGIVARDYLQDERILLPLITAEKFSALKNLFVVTAGFGGIDDVIRLANKTSTEALWFPNDLQASVTDILTRDFFSANQFNIQYYSRGPLSQPVNSVGHFPGLLGVIRNDSISLLIVTHKLTPEHFQVVLPKKQTILVIGAGSRLSAGEWIALHELGYDLLICSMIEQSEFSTSDALSVSVDNEPPQYVIDMRRRGSITFRAHSQAGYIIR